MKKCRRSERAKITHYIADKAGEYDRLKIPASSIQAMREQIWSSFENRVAGEIRANHQTYVQGKTKVLQKSKLGLRNLSTSPLAINHFNRAKQGG